MVRSFGYVAYAGLAEARRRGIVPPEQLQLAEAWARYRRWASALFVRANFGRAVDAPLLPVTDADRAVLLDALLLEKALYELAYELDHRPEWAGMSLRGSWRWSSSRTSPNSPANAPRGA